MAGKQNFVSIIPDGDDRERMVCKECGHIDYRNPKLVGWAGGDLRRFNLVLLAMFYLPILVLVTPAE